MRVLGFLLTAWLFVASGWAQSPAADLIKSGNDYLNKGDFAHAIEAYTDYIRINPGSPAIFYARGSAYYRSHDDDRAIKDYTDAIRLAPDYGEAFRDRAHAYEDKGDYEHAIQDYTQAIAIRPDDSYLRYDRAFAYERMGEYQPAIADLTEVISRFPKAGDAYRNRGRLWLYSANLAQAQQDLSRAVQLYPSDSYNVIWLYLSRAKAANHVENGPAEEELAKNAAKLNLGKWPGPVVQLFLGKNTKEAVLQAASDIDPVKKMGQECEANFYVAEYQAFHGQRSAAGQGFNTVIESCPRNYFSYLPAARAELQTKLPKVR